MNRDSLLKFTFIWTAIFLLAAYLPGFTGSQITPTPNRCSECEINATRNAALKTVMASQQQMTPQPDTERPVVRAVMFWMAGCGHCEYVLNDVLPPLEAKYGDQLDILLIELSGDEEVESLYQTADYLDISPEWVVVPFLIIGENVLMGSEQIPAELSDLIEQYLAKGGVGYPKIPALVDVLPSASPGITAATPIQTPLETDIPVTASPEIKAQVVATRPPVNPPSAHIRSKGFDLAAATMIGMAASLVFTGVRLAWGNTLKNKKGRGVEMDYAVPVLALVGLVVAGYLAYVETQAVEAACGPIGDCNTVQTSSYARLFGVLPIGWLGVFGYAAILALWLWQWVRSDRFADYSRLLIFGIALFGSLFSFYLTYLELFVIKAVCVWCLMSAVTITVLMLFSINLVEHALQSVVHEESQSDFD